MTEENERNSDMLWMFVYLPVALIASNWCLVNLWGFEMGEAICLDSIWLVVFFGRMINAKGNRPL